MQEELRKNIDDFLKDKRDGNSDFAPVTESDMRLLHGIMQGLLDAKFVRDCDGDLPVQYAITNRHTHTQAVITSIVRTEHDQTPYRELSMYASLARWANENVSRISNTLRYEEMSNENTPKHN